MHSQMEATVSLLLEALIKIFWAFCGGLALIVPMLIMVLRKGRTTSLVTVSVSVFLWSMLLASWTIIAALIKDLAAKLRLNVSTEGQKLGGKEILAATAACTAVLVVFVGTSS